MLNSLALWLFSRPLLFDSGLVLWGGDLWGFNNAHHLLVSWYHVSILLFDIWAPICIAVLEYEVKSFLVSVKSLQKFVFSIGCFVEDTWSPLAPVFPVFFAIQIIQTHGGW